MKQRRDNGYTLVEVMIAIVIGLFLISAAAVTYVAQNRSYVVQDTVSETNTQSKIAHDMILSDLKGAGFGAPDDMDEISVGGFTEVITPTDSDTTYDTISIVSGYSVVGVLQCEIAPFDTNSCGQTANTLTFTTAPTSLVAGDVVSVDGIENAVVNSIGGNVVGLDRILTTRYAAGRPVYLESAITYSVDTNMDLWRGTNIIGENIEDLQFAYAMDEDDDGEIDDLSGNGSFGPEDFIDFAFASPAWLSPSWIRAVRVNVMARTDRADPAFSSQGNPPASIENRAHSMTNDDYRRRWWQSPVTIRKREE